ncbi:MAG TPA: dCTP deaminase [Candidatus Thermoplasmatota archaeon]|nr:dCTP deaminase [Candidatus Thermoplasmatota archaeon]
MGILSDRDILARRAAGEPIVDPFEERSLTPNGYDLRVAEVLVPDVSPDVVREGKAVVPGGARFLVSTIERVHMPADVCGSLWLRSSYARRGVFGSFGKVEAGFEGTLTVGGLNAGRGAIDILIGDRFCQLVFERLESLPQRSYVERSGNYQGQTGITLARDDPAAKRLQPE